MREQTHTHKTQEHQNGFIVYYCAYLPTQLMFVVQSGEINHTLRNSCSLSSLPFSSPPFYATTQPIHMQATPKTPRDFFAPDWRVVCREQALLRPLQVKASSPCFARRRGERGSRCRPETVPSRMWASHNCRTAYELRGDPKMKMYRVSSLEASQSAQV